MARRRRNKPVPATALTESGAPRKAFDESKHRRAAGGRFGSGGGAQSAGPAPRASSSVDSPVRRMHALADKMHGKPRADILAAAQAIGINRSTASTQLYVYQRNRAARELKAAVANGNSANGNSANPRETLQVAAAHALGVPVAPVSRLSRPAQQPRPAPAPRPTPAPKPAPAPTPKPPAPAPATDANRFAMRPGERPVAAFHRIADEMHDRPRSEVIATAVNAGVNRSTASVQYTQWQRNRGAGSAPTTRAAPAARPAAATPVAGSKPAVVAPVVKPKIGERKLIKDTTEGVPARGTPERELHDKLLRAASVFEGTTFHAHYRGGKITGFDVSGRGVQISRRFTGDTVDHSYFELGNEQRGSGAAKTFLRETVAAYKKAGYKKVEVHANIDVGGYAWLRYGFEPKAGHSKAMLRGAVDRRLDTPGVHEALTDAQQTQVLSLANQGKFYEVATMTTPIKQRDGTSVPLGRHLFMNSDWYGTLDLNNKRSMDIFDRYAGEKK